MKLLCLPRFAAGMVAILALRFKNHPLLSTSPHPKKKSSFFKDTHSINAPDWVKQWYRLHFNQWDSSFRTLKVDISLTCLSIVR